MDSHSSFNYSNLDHYLFKVHDDTNILVMIICPINNNNYTYL